MEHPSWVCDSISLKLFEEKLGPTCKYGIGTPFFIDCKVVPRLKIRIDKGQLLLPATTYVIASIRNGPFPSCVYGDQSVWGKFDKSIVDSLNSYDTIVIQNKIISLSR